MKGVFIALIATAILISAGCGKSEETTATTPPNATTGGTSTTSSPDAAMAPDFSTDDKAAATVMNELQKESTLSGTSLKVEAKDKMIHIMGDVQNNDQKRKIDEITKTLEANSAGYKFMNMTIVKG